MNDNLIEDIETLVNKPNANSLVIANSKKNTMKLFRGSNPVDSVP